MHQVPGKRDKPDLAALGLGTINPPPEPPPQFVPPPPVPEPPRRAVDVVMGEKFAKTLFATARHKALYGGRGSSKSWSVATYCVVRAMEARKRIVCCRQFQNSIRDSSKELIERRIRDMEVSSEFAVTDRTIVHNKLGSDFLFMGLERNVESIRSLEGADIVWIEEARTINAKSMEVLLPTVRKAGSELIWTWNPELPDDPVDAYFRGPQPPPRSIVTFVDYTDNPFFYGTELANEMEVLKAGNFARYKHVWLGEYDTKHESKVFPNARIGTVVVNSDEMPAFYGLDFGFGNDPSFITKVDINEHRKQIYIAREASGRVAMDELPTLIRGVIENDRDLIKADSSQPGTIEFLKRRGFNVVAAHKGPGSVKSGINFLQSYDIVIDPSCEQMREEARLYSWMTDRRTQQILSVPVDANNHGWDSVRYALEDFALEGDDPVADPHGGVIRLFKFW
ncbi:PBSX family phage terminase large subunit [Bradyrhizobium neotropicale]|uniref:PBSX family phage terminase large subunit n=1 Tax=Bradyrhizobium neotropicale TaxID=1497615 RepID=UPI001AD67170|nr:PBSX family phage terminase large subunit [Bradyrhizobium neotropicale]MBO4228434.1 PBSX family phage terminase large subunit [Bradyrhizobium neotropicale]